MAGAHLTTSRYYAQFSRLMSICCPTTCFLRNRPLYCEHRLWFGSIAVITQYLPNIPSAFGFDKETVPAHQGTVEIAKHLEILWGLDGFVFLLDEGNGMVNNWLGWGANWASLKVAERGYINFKVCMV